MGMARGVYIASMDITKRVYRAIIMVMNREVYTASIMGNARGVKKNIIMDMAWGSI